MKTADEQYDEYVAERHKHHVAVMHAKLRAGDEKIGDLIDDAIGVKLPNRKAWLQVYFETARGDNALDGVINEIIQEMAQVQAYKDGEAYERAIRLERENSKRIADGLIKDSFNRWPRPVWFGDEK